MASLYGLFKYTRFKDETEKKDVGEKINNSDRLLGRKLDEANKIVKKEKIYVNSEYMRGLDQLQQKFVHMSGPYLMHR